MKAELSVKKAEKVLSDHQWHKPTEVALTKMWLIHGAGSSMGVAESDSGRYICIPDETTPLLAPDGT